MRRFENCKKLQLLINAGADHMQQIPADREEFLNCRFFL